MNTYTEPVITQKADFSQEKTRIVVYRDGVPTGWATEHHGIFWEITLYDAHADTVQTIGLSTKGIALDWLKDHARMEIIKAYFPWFR